jgi:hypothetical protein
MPSPRVQPLLQSRLTSNACVVKPAGGAYAQRRKSPSLSSMPAVSRLSQPRSSSNWSIIRKSFTRVSGISHHRCTLAGIWNLSSPLHISGYLEMFSSPLTLAGIWKCSPHRCIVAGSMRLHLGDDLKVLLRLVGHRLGVIAAPPWSCLGVNAAPPWSCLGVNAAPPWSCLGVNAAPPWSHTGLGFASMSHTALGVASMSHTALGFASMSHTARASC